MAVPYTGTTEVTPAARAPDATQQIDATPEAFGAATARGLQNLGQGAATAGRFWGGVQTDEVLNNAMKEANDTLEEFKTMRGGDALNAQPAIRERLDDITKRSRSQLGSAEQQQAFDRAYRPFSERYVAGQVRSHAVSQGHAFAKSTNDATHSNSLGMIPGALDDPDAVRNFIGDATNAAVKQVELDGGGDEAKLAVINKTKADGYKIWIDAVGARDPLRASEMTEQYKKELGINYTAVAGKTRALTDRQEGIEVADQVSGHRPVPAPSVANVPSGFLTAIKQSEGFSPKAKWDHKQFSYGYGTRASGEGQEITREEADKQFNGEITKAAAVVDKVNPNLDPGTRAALVALTYNAGSTWTEAGLGAAVKSGNVEEAKKLFLQYVRASGEVNEGLLARRYREAQWFGQGDAPAGAAPILSKAQAYERVIDATQGNPTRQQAAVSHLNEIYSIYHAQVAQANTAFTQKVKDSTAEAMTTGHVATPLTEDEFVQNATVTGKTVNDGVDAYHDYQDSVQLGTDLSMLATMDHAQRESLFAKYEPQPGEGYDFQAKRMGQIAQAAQRIDTDKAKDPALFALTRLPGVRESFERISAGKTPEEKTALAAQFVLTTTAEQERIGVPSSKVTILPKSMIDEMNLKFTRPATEGGSANLAADIQAQARLWGDHWPQVYRQLAKDTQPVVRVIGSGIKPLAAQVLSDLASVPLKAILTDDNSEKDQTIKNDVLTAMRPFALTLGGQDGSIQMFNDFRGQAEKLSAYYVVRGATSSEASTKAFDDLVGHKYDFADTYRVPKTINIPPATIETGVRWARQDIMSGKLAGDIDPARGMGLSENYLIDATRRAYGRDGKWVTSPNETGLVLTYGDQAIRRKNGEPVFLSWKQLQDLSKSRESDEIARTRMMVTAP